jgi:hypothetical protein
VHARARQFTPEHVNARQSNPEYARARQSTPVNARAWKSTAENSSALEVAIIFFFHLLKPFFNYRMCKSMFKTPFQVY